MSSEWAAYIGLYVLRYGYALKPEPWYIAWSFGTAVMRAESAPELVWA